MHGGQINFRRPRRKKVTQSFFFVKDTERRQHSFPGFANARRHVRALYDAGVNYADWIFGGIVALLKKNGSYDNSLIAVVSDHGEEFWEHGDTGHKHLFVETLHVPLLIKFPGGKYGGMKISTPVGQFDLMPTLLDHLRITPRLKLQARALAVRHCQRSPRAAGELEEAARSSWLPVGKTFPPN